jgi:hypothetical protein
MRYFADSERDYFKIASDTIGALIPGERLVLIHDSIAVSGREGQTIGEEIGHFILHAKVAPAGQMALGLGLPEQTQAASQRFYRSESEAFLDGEREPAWMTREASFFGACLQMPRDRYLPAAKQRLLHSVLGHIWARYPLRSLDEKLAAVERGIDLAAPPEVQPAWLSPARDALFDNTIVEMALDKLGNDHGDQVSRAAQRRRLVELGLVMDAAEMVKGPGGVVVLPKWSYLFLSDEIRPRRTK